MKMSDDLMQFFLIFSPPSYLKLVVGIFANTWVGEWNYKWFIAIYPPQVMKKQLTTKKKQAERKKKGKQKWNATWHTIW